MERRQTYLELIAVIRHALRKEPLPAHIHWDSLIPLAAGHRLMGFVHRALSEMPNRPEHIVKQVESAYFEAVGKQIRLDHYADALFRLFTEREIPHIPLQGYCLRAQYPQPNWRTSQDLNILVAEEKREEVAALIEDMGFRRVKQEDSDLYLLDQVKIEIRYSLSDGDLTDGGEPLWNSLVTADGISYSFSPTALYAYQMSLMRRNFSSDTGIGIRSMLDLYMCRQKLDEADYPVLDDWFAARGITDFARCMFDLSEVWFGDMPATNDTILLGSYIAANGGGNGLAGSETPRENLFRRIFPSFRVMRREFKAVRCFPPLLPLFWVIRWFLLPARKKKAADANERYRKMLDRVRELTGVESIAP